MIFIGEIAALCTALLWSGTSIVFTEASLRVSSVLVNITRLTLASVFLLLTVIIFNIPVNLSSHQIIMLVISGFIGFVFGDSFLFKSFQHIGARLGMLIMSLAPAMAAVLAYIFLDEVLSIWAIIGITLTGIALVVLYREENPSSNYKISKIGILYGSLGALGQAVGLIFAKIAFNEGEINGFWAAFIRVLAGTFFMIPLVFFIKQFRNPLKIFIDEKKAFLYTAIGAFTGPYLGVTLSLVAISYTFVGVAATLMGTVPIIMLPMVGFYYKEKLSWASVAGAVLAVTGIAMLFLT
jgi:drug/metabolite transporter (DMT)-like permease